MNTSFYNGVSGVKSYQYGIDVIGNNIANVNTYGFKGSRTEFTTIFSRTLSESKSLPTSNQIGLGSMVAATALDLSQGSLINTDGNFDLAIEGEGWFMLSQGDQKMFTRSGGFYIGKDGYLVNENGDYLLGVVANSFNKKGNDYEISENSGIDILPNSEMEKIFLPNALTIPAMPTSYVKIIGNLNSSKKFDFVEKSIDINSATLSINANSATVSGSVAANGDILNPQKDDEVVVVLKNSNNDKIYVATKLDENLNWSINNYNITQLDPANNAPISIDSITLKTYQEIDNSAHFATPVILENGERGIVDMSFSKILPQKKSGVEWNGVIKLLNSNKEVIDEQSGVLSYNEVGALISNTIPPLKRADGGELNVILGTPYDPNISNSGFDGIVSMDKKSEFYKEEHDGYITGDLQRYSVENNGIIYAAFDNGKSVAVANIPIYHFQNDQGLEKIGANYFVETPNSGKAFMYVDEDGKVFKNSKIKSNMLEGSNVNLTTALTEMIVTQKAFDANAKSITTSDQMVQTAINMKK